jgi:transposase
MATSRLQFTKEFRLQVLLEIESGKSLAQATGENQIHPTLLAKWRTAHKEYAEQAFAGNDNAYSAEAKIAELERLIGQLTIESSVLRKALSRLEARSASPKASGKR